MRKFTLNGWRRPKGDRWELAGIRPYVPMVPEPPNLYNLRRALLGGIAAVAIVLLTGLLWHFGSWLPASLALPLIGLVDQDFFDHWWDSAEPALQQGNAGTFNMAAFGSVGDTVEARINAGIAAAKIAAAMFGGSAFGFVPMSMLPFNAAQVVFDNTVHMVREGGLISAGVWDPHAYGASGAGDQDDQPGMQAALNAAANTRNLTPAGRRGGVVQLQGATYTVFSGIILPQAVNDQSVVLRGAGKRASYISAVGLAATFAGGVIGFGPGTIDASGATAFITQYCGIENLAINGAALTGGGSAVGVRMTETQKCWMHHVLVESFTTGTSMGLWLRGSTTAGLGAAAAPHCWRCNFFDVDVVTSMRPLVAQNVDECDFYTCNFALPPGLATAGLIAIELIQYHNLCFSGLLMSGSNDANRPNYIGLKCDAPVNGDCIGLSIFRVVAEGFDYALYFAGGNMQDVWVYHFGGAESALGQAGNRKFFYNGADDGGAERSNNVHIFFGGSALGAGVSDYHSGKLPTSEAITLSMLGGGAFTPSVAGSNSFATNTDTAGSTLTNFLNGSNGQVIWVRLDPNITVVHNFALIRCPGAVNLVGAAHKMAGFVKIGGVWECISVSAN